MNNRKTMTINVTAREMEIIEKMAEEKGISKTGLVRQALRLYQMINDRIEKGERLFVDGASCEKSIELLLIK